ncbi:MAG: hypothetical protein PVG66_15210 [Chromatiales bacterium]
MDDRLKQLISAYLAPPNSKKNDRLLGRGGALESFSSRIELARRLSLVVPEVSKSLDWVRDIRNDAAHREEFSFGENRVRDLTVNIVAALELKERAPNLLSEPYNSIKGNFIACVAILEARITLEKESLSGPSHIPVANEQISYNIK